MFAASLVVLVLFAAILHLHEAAWGQPYVYASLAALAVLYPLFWLETFLHWRLGSPRWRKNLWFCAIPVMRIGARDQMTGTRIWLPFAGWKTVNRELERRLIRDFSVPMIIAALLVLPVIIIEFFWLNAVHENPLWHLGLCATTGFIWAAFTFEFTLLISVVKYPVDYARRHWIDALIIVLPMVYFMRVVRLAQIARVQQLSRTARLYRLRGLGMRLWRGLVALEIIEMIILRNPERRLEKLEMRLEDKLEEIEFLRKDIARLQRRLAEQRSKEAAAMAASSPTGAASAQTGCEPATDDTTGETLAQPTA